MQMNIFTWITIDYGSVDTEQFSTCLQISFHNLNDI